VTLLNVLIGGALDLVLMPLRYLPPLAGLAAMSVLAAAGALLVFRATSNQTRLRAVRRQLQAAVFEMRLFHDDVRAVFRALGEAFAHQAAALRLTILPMAATVLLLAPVVAHLHAVYGYEGLEPGRPVLLTAHLQAGVHGGDVRLEVPAGVEVLTPPVWFPAVREVVWRVTPASSGRYEVHVVLPGTRAAKTLDASRPLIRRSPVRPARGVLNQLRDPAEPPLPADGPLVAIRVQYPERRVAVLGWRLHWMAVFVLATMVAALAMRKRLRVTL
jgi:hypothetical protein